MIEIHENGIYMNLEHAEDGTLKLLHFSSQPYDPALIPPENKRGFRLIELQVPGLDRPEERFGTKFVVTAPGYRLKFERYLDERNEFGRKLTFITADEETGLIVFSCFQFYDGIAAVRSWTEVENHGTETRTLEYLSSFALTGLGKGGLLNYDEKLLLSIPHNSWQREIQWTTHTLPELGLCLNQPKYIARSSKTIRVTNTGNWSAKEYIPAGFLEDTETGECLMWQIEHNGSWHWEISDQNGFLYLQLSGPNETWSHWSKELKPGERFVSVPTAVSPVTGGFEKATEEMTKYRRRIRRPNADNEKLPVIFNDYMNCLWADPTTAKELPLIEAAAKAGAEYYVIDAGWYSAGFWWDNVGEWKPSAERFPEGLPWLMDYIRSKGMIPGVWLEIEVMGINCELAKKVPDNWFFCRHGKRVFDRSRYQLDFRNPDVRAFADEVIDRLVKEYHVGYIKMDYNIEPGIGTEINADSFGDGLLEHERAYLRWLDDVFARYPDLVIENCSSGGLRMDHAMLSRYSIQSTSDVEDYRVYATIAANAPSVLTPEQAAVWSYPLSEASYEETAFNMVNAMMLRIHQSGHLAEINRTGKTLVKEGIRTYKRMRNDIRKAFPFWPLGLSNYADPWVCLGLRTDRKAYVAVWCRNPETDTAVILLDFLKEKKVRADLLYPAYAPCMYSYNPGTASLTVKLPEPYSARLFLLRW
ncbi:MAG: alpha-galactosidase [Anaerolineaceae bacterium]|nr:alpha-galactosidase [Anaerolineaceae bacterium]